LFIAARKQTSGGVARPFMRLEIFEIGAACGPNILGEREMKMPQIFKRAKVDRFQFDQVSKLQRGLARKKNSLPK